MYEIPLQSGLVIQSNPLYGRDVVRIAERVGASASGDTIVEFMQSCTTGVVDPGPYPMLSTDAKSVPWKRVLWGDLFVALIKLRIESFPAHRGTFDFEVPCKYCRSLMSGSIDLGEFLADPDHVQALPEASKEVLLANGILDGKLPGGRAYRFDFARQEQDDPMRVLMKREQRKKSTDVETIAKRIKWVDGLKTGKGEEARDLPAIWRWAHGLTSDEMDSILAAFAVHDIVVDSRILAWCDNREECGREQRIELPLDIGFFRPRTATKKSATVPGAASQTSSPASPANGGSSSKGISSGTSTKDPASP